MYIFLVILDFVVFGVAEAVYCCPGDSVAAFVAFVHVAVVGINEFFKGEIRREPLW